MSNYDKGLYSISCPKCDGTLLSYSSDFLVLDDEYLVRFHHTGEQNTECDGYFQVITSDFQEYGVKGEAE